jgi:hypothetical protein
VIDGVLVGKTATEALSLFNTILKMIEHAEAEGKSMTIGDVLAELPPQALKLADRFVQDLMDLQKDFDEAFRKDPLGLDKSLSVLQSETWFWRRKRYKLLRDFAPTVDAVNKQLDALISDFVAVSHCREAETLVAESMKEVDEIRETLNESTDFRKLPVRDVLKNMIDNASQVRNKLQKIVYGK